jgi:hypothetical protein
MICYILIFCYDLLMFCYDLLYAYVLVWSALCLWSVMVCYMLMFWYDLLYAHDLLWSAICLCSGMICYMLMLCYDLLYAYVLYDLGVYGAYDLWAIAVAVGASSDRHADISHPSLLLHTAATAHWHQSPVATVWTTSDGWLTSRSPSLVVHTVVTDGAMPFATVGAL